MSAPTATQPLVQLSDILLRFGRKIVLDRISLTLGHNEVVGLIGPGGSGKTQLIRVVSSLRLPQQGSVSLLGQQLTRRNRGKWPDIRRQIGLQFQNFALFDYLNVGDNVAFSLRHGLHIPEETVSRRITGALKLVGLEGTETRMPSDLSGGMRRRVAIARVIAARPRIALFDDPVAGLDPVNSAKIMQLLSQYATQADSLVIIATHDLERLLPITTRLVALFDGRVLFHGTTRQLQDCRESTVCNFVAAGTESWLEDGA